MHHPFYIIRPIRSLFCSKPSNTSVLLRQEVKVIIVAHRALYNLCPFPLLQPQFFSLIHSSPFSLGPLLFFKYAWESFTSELLYLPCPWVQSLCSRCPCGSQPLLLHVFVLMSPSQQDLPGPPIQNHNRSASCPVLSILLPCLTVLSHLPQSNILLYLILLSVSPT
jgi:hypothetical protein